MESFNGKLRDELLDREVFYTLLEVRVLTNQYRQTYDGIRQHSSLGYRPPAPDTILLADRVPVLVGLTQRVVQPLGIGHSVGRGAGWRLMRSEWGLHQQLRHQVPHRARG